MGHKTRKKKRGEIRGKKKKPGRSWTEITKNHTPSWGKTTKSEKIHYQRTRAAPKKLSSKTESGN